MTAARTPIPGRTRHRARHHSGSDLGTDQPAGRHRHPPRRIPPSLPASLLFEYAAGSKLGSRQRVAKGPARSRRMRRQFAMRGFRGRGFRGRGLRMGGFSGRGLRMRGFGRRGFSGRVYGGRPVAVRWAFFAGVPPVAAAVAVLVGYALLPSPGIGGRHGAVPGFTPQVSVPAIASASPPASAAPSPHAVRWTAMPTSSATPASQVPAPKAAAPIASVRTPASSVSPKPTIVVRYHVNSQGSSGFQGEIEVTNNGSQPIGDWEIVLSLPDDKVVSVSNASGFVSNGILLLQPGAGEPAIPASGGTLNVFFIALGLQEVPFACAFDGIACQ